MVATHRRLDRKMIREPIWTLPPYSSPMRVAAAGAVALSIYYGVHNGNKPRRGPEEEEKR